MTPIKYKCIKLYNNVIDIVFYQIVDVAYKKC